MALHKFKVGDVVTFTSPFPKAKAVLCEIVRLLPDDSVDPVYRIKSKAEHYERVVKEYELAPSAA